ncbi:MAG: indole-3-glycerol phosphate synthase TrpC [Candidatus Electrothrix communis]|nr:MAG: indole-3-glycerol phosphate synthase TrpC [Candidatus Electrothrix communis]
MYTPEGEILINRAIFPQDAVVGSAIKKKAMIIEYNPHDNSMILDTIVARKKEEVAALKQQGIRPLESEAPLDPPRGFMQALLDAPGVAIIAEAKKASPSKGVIEPNFDPQKIARNYKQGGAHAMSVLTDRDFFQGSIDYIPLVRNTVDLPVLRKEFIIDPLQIEEAAAFGSDAILLIAAILETAQLREFRLQAEEAGMDVLVEVHNEAELEKTLAAESRLIGINNRNLNDFNVDLETTFRLQREIPTDIPIVSESGISSRSEMLRLQEAGITAALIGESLMRSNEQGKTLRHFLST